jgi:hypothetical protein
MGRKDEGPTCTKRSSKPSSGSLRPPRPPRPPPELLATGETAERLGAAAATVRGVATRLPASATLLLARSPLAAANSTGAPVAMPERAGAVVLAALRTVKEDDMTPATMAAECPKFLILELRQARRRSVHHPLTHPHASHLGTRASIRVPVEQETSADGGRRKGVSRSSRGRQARRRTRPAVGSAGPTAAEGRVGFKTLVNMGDIPTLEDYNVLTPPEVSSSTHPSRRLYPPLRTLAVSRAL